MTIVKTRDYQEPLKKIFIYIAEDTQATAIEFNTKLNKKNRRCKNVFFYV